MEYYEEEDNNSWSIFLLFAGVYDLQSTQVLHNTENSKNPLPNIKNLWTDTLSDVLPIPILLKH